MDEFNLNPNEGTEEVVTPQETEQVETTRNESEEVVEPQVDIKPQQSAEDNAKYAAIRREAEQKAYVKAQDELIANMYGQSHGIYTKADYDRAVAENEREAQIQAEAQQQGISEDLARRMRDLEETANTTKAEKAEYQRQLALINEDKALQTDETFSDYYKEHTENIKELADKFKVDLTTAMLLSIKDNFKAIKEGTVKKVQQETINNIIKNGQSSPGSVGSGGNQQTNSIYNMSSADFKKMQNDVLNGTRKNI